MADQKSHVAPGLELRQRLPANQVPHDIWIRAQLEVILEIGEAIRAQNETLRLKSELFHFPLSTAIMIGEIIWFIGRVYRVRAAWMKKILR
jgi:hypothetical protein